MSLDVAVLAMLGAGLTLYVLLGGADFGGGVWDLLASGPLRERQRALIAEAIGPVWEANHVWLIFVITGLFAAFPPAFAALGYALYVPFSIALVGIVFRGAAFVFRAHGEPNSPWQRAWTRVFGVASLVTPLVLGAAGASIATGRIRVRGASVDAPLLWTWTGPLSILAGALALAMCAYLAATYLTVEAEARGEHGLTEAFRSRALGAGVVAGALAAAGLPVIRNGAPLLWEGVLHRGWPLVILSAAGGLSSLALTARRWYRSSRVAAAVAVGSVLWAWGAAQWPYLIPPDVTVSSAAAPAASLRPILIGFVVGGALLLPSLVILFRVFKGAGRHGVGGTA